MQKKFIHKPTGIVYFMAEIKVGEDTCFMLISPDYGGRAFAHWCAPQMTEEMAFGGCREKFEFIGKVFCPQCGESDEIIQIDAPEIQVKFEENNLLECQCGHCEGKSFWI